MSREKCTNLKATLALNLRWSGRDGTMSSDARRAALNLLARCLSRAPRLPGKRLRYKDVGADPRHPAMHRCLGGEAVISNRSLWRGPRVLRNTQSYQKELLDLCCHVATMVPDGTTNVDEPIECFHDVPSPRVQQRAQSYESKLLGP